VLSACLRMLSTGPKASTARDRLTLSRHRRLRFEDGDARGCVALLYRCTGVRRENPTCLCRGIPQGCYPNP
jgi:hypothetical protein